MTIHYVVLQSLFHELFCESLRIDHWIWASRMPPPPTCSVPLNSSIANHLNLLPLEITDWNRMFPINGAIFHSFCFWNWPIRPFITNPPPLSYKYPSPHTPPRHTVAGRVFFREFVNKFGNLYVINNEFDGKLRMGEAVRVAQRGGGGGVPYSLL